MKRINSFIIIIIIIIIIILFKIIIKKRILMDRFEQFYSSPPITLKLQLIPKSFKRFKVLSLYVIKFYIFVI